MEKFQTALLVHAWPKLIGTEPSSVYITVAITVGPQC